MSRKVQYPNGFVGVAPDKVALGKRDGYKALGPADPAPAPKKEVKKIDRDALMKRAIKENLAEKTELLKLSDAELAALVGEEK